MRLLHHMLAAVADGLGRASRQVPAPRTVSRWPPVGLRGALIVTVRCRMVSRCFYRLDLSPTADDDRAPPYRALRRGGIPVSAARYERRRPARWPGRVVGLEEANKVGWRQCM
ncbi:hypothetical protein Vqi01_30670 [Micromonospora qiuiae]|uniref:Secreted protein n=1 Tax=Micromonospora qiuiae TaxID=502268 RepID=A0ABQ4JD74_9ACTN|nr:hypothetical protein Vqi01_30670 [Micromonospora qiuiae]